MYYSIEQTGNKIFIRDSHSDRTNQSFKPKLYKRTALENTVHKSVNNHNLIHKEFDCINDANKFKNDYKDMELFGNQNWYIQYITENYNNDYQFQDIEIAYIDIETVSLDNSYTGFPSPSETPVEVASISMYFSHHGWKMWGLKDYTPDPDTEYFKCNSEKELLLNFLHYWNSHCPHALTSWNGDLFDVPYLIRRIKKVLSAKSANLLSPFGKLTEKNAVDDYGNDVFSYRIWGVQQLDYLDLYKKFTYVTPPNYKLDTIGEIECNINKVDMKGLNFKQLYDQDYQTFMTYNKQDVNIIIELNKKLKLLELVIDVAYMSGINYTDVFSPVRVWDGLIWNDQISKNIVVPITKPQESKEYPGGYVKEPRLGLQGHLISYDLSSMYPSIIREFNIGVETKMNNIGTINEQSVFDGTLDTTEYPSCSYTMNGVLYDNTEQSFFSRLMEKMTVDRKLAKSSMIEKQKELEKLKTLLQTHNQDH